MGHQYILRYKNILDCDLSLYNPNSSHSDQGMDWRIFGWHKPYQQNTPNWQYIPGDIQVDYQYNQAGMNTRFVR